MPYTVATDMDSPNPDSGEEYFHTNTQLFNTLDEHNRFKIGEAVTAPWNAPPSPVRRRRWTGSSPTTSAPSPARWAVSRPTTSTRQIMTGYTPEQVPVLNGIAREFGVFDHWFCEVPSQTFMNRSFWTAATSSGIVVNSPVRKWLQQERRRDDLRAARAARQDLEGLRGWSRCRSRFTASSTIARLKDRLATNFVPFAEFEKDAAAGTLPDFSLIEPNFIGGHGDYHPAFGRAFGATTSRSSVDPPSSVLGGEAFLERIFNAYRSGDLGVGLERVEHDPADRLGRAGRNLRPRAPRAGPAARPRSTGRASSASSSTDPATAFPRSSSPPGSTQGSVFNDEYRHTSLIATLRKSWNLGEAFTERDASARTFDHLFTLDTPRDPQTWATITALPVPAWHLDEEVVGKALSSLGKSMGQGLIEHARELGLELPPHLDDPAAEPTPQDIVDVLREVAWHYFPLLAPDGAGTGAARGAPRRRDHVAFGWPDPES